MLDIAFKAFTETTRPTVPQASLPSHRSPTPWTPSSQSLQQVLIPHPAEAFPLTISHSAYQSFFCNRTVRFKLEVTLYVLRLKYTPTNVKPGQAFNKKATPWCPPTTKKKQKSIWSRTKCKLSIIQMQPPFVKRTGCLQAIAQGGVQHSSTMCRTNSLVPQSAQASLKGPSNMRAHSVPTEDNCNASGYALPLPPPLHNIFSKGLGHLALWVLPSQVPSVERNQKWLRGSFG